MPNKTRFVAVLMISFTLMALMVLLFETPVTGSGLAYPNSPQAPQQLTVTKTANTDYVRAGDLLTYTLTVANNESITVTATILDILPPNVTVVGTSGNTGLIPGYIAWSLVELAPGAVWTETVVVIVAEGYAGPLDNTLRVTVQAVTVSANAIVTAEVGIEGLTAINDSPTQLGATTTLTATVDAGSNVAYVWNFGDGTSGEGAIVTHTYLHTGSFAAVVTAINHVSWERATTMVTITDIPITGLTVVNDSPTLIGAPTTLTATVATGSNVTYAWDFGDGESGSGAVVSHVYPSVGTYTAVVTASNSAGAISDTSMVMITVAPVTGLTVVNDSPTLLGDPTTFTATVATGVVETYVWDFGDGESGSGAVVTHTYPSLGFYTATVTATNEFNAISATSRVTITDGSITGLTARNSSPTRIGSATQLTATVATGVGAIAYVWDFGDGGTGSGPLVSHVYSSLGTYTAVVTASNEINVMTATTTVTIIDVPVTKLSATNDGPTALGNSTTFTANISTGTNVMYSWTFGDGEIGYGRVVSHTYRAGGTYTAIVTARNSAGEWTASTQVKVAAHIYLPLVLRSWSGTVTPTVTPTVTLTPPPQDVYVLPNYSYYETTGGPLYIVGEAKNNGSTYAVLVDVPVQLLDSSGNLLNSYKVYTSLDLPVGEKSCFHLVINSPPANWASIQFGAPAYQSFANRPWPNLVIYDDSGAKGTDNTYQITGSVRNQESKLVTGVLVEGAVYNAEGKIIGCRLVPPVDNSLTSGQSSPFELFYGYDGDYSGITIYRLQADGLVSK